MATVEQPQQPQPEEVSNEAMATVAEYAPVTAERKVRNDLETKLPKPCNLRSYIHYISITYIFVHKITGELDFLK